MLKTTLMNDLKTAMKQKNDIKKGVITLLRGAILNEEKSLKRELTEQEQYGMVRREIKQAQQTLDSATHAYREDIERKAKTQIHILSQYLPVQMTEQEVKDYVASMALADADMNMKTLMGRLNAEIGSKAEGKIISAVAKEVIALNKAKQVEGEVKETPKPKKAAPKPRAKKVDNKE